MAKSDPQGEPGFWAYISYSHRDSGWSDWLFKALETYQLPRRLRGRETRSGPVPARLYPIFRDRDELPGSAELSANLLGALVRSRYLVVICSPHAARSRWVNEEIRQFKALGRADRILAFIVDGEPNASDRPESGDVECFPPELRFRALGEEGQVERVEPIAADVRAGKDGRRLALLKVIAGIAGVGFDELRQRERQRQRARRLRWGAAAAALGIAALAAGAWVAVDARIERHVEMGREAMMSRDYGRAAPWLVSATELQRALPFARARPYLPAMLGIVMSRVELLDRIITFPGSASFAWDVNPGRTHFAQALLESKIVVATLQGYVPPRVFAVAQKEIKQLRLDADDSGATYYGDHAVHHIDFATGVSREIARDPEGARVRALTPFGRVAVYAYPDRREYVRLADGRKLGTFAKGTASRLDSLFVFDSRGEKALATTESRNGWTVAIVDLVDGRASPPIEVTFAPTAAAFDGAGARVALTGGFDEAGSNAAHAGERLGTVGVWSAATGKADWQTLYPATLRDVAFSPDASLLVTTSGDHRAVVWNAQRGYARIFLEDLDAQIRDASFLPGGERVVTFSQDGGPRVWDVATGNVVAKLEGLDEYFARVFALPDGNSIVAARTQGTGQVLRWRLDDPRLARGLAQHGSPLLGAGASENGERLVTFGEDKTAMVWDTQRWKPLAKLDSKGMLDISADGKRYFDSDGDTGRTRVGETATGRATAEQVVTPPLLRVTGWTHRGEVVTLDTKGEALLFDGTTLARRSLGKFPKASAIGASSDGATVVVVAESTLEIIDGASGKRLASFPKPPFQSVDPWMAFSESGDRVLVNFYRNSQIFDVRSQSRRALVAAGSLPSVGASFVCDSRYATLSLGNYRFQLHDGRTGERLRDFEGALGTVASVSCDTEAGLLIAHDMNGYVTVWRVEGGPPVARFKLSMTQLWSSVWIARSRAVAVASGDTRLYIVPIPLERRSVEELRESLRCRIPHRVVGEVLVRDSTTSHCERMTPPPGT